MANYEQKSWACSVILPNVGAALRDHSARLAQQFEGGLAEHFFEAHYDATDHGDGTEQDHQELNYAALSLRYYLASEHRHACDKTADCQSNHDQQVAVGEDDDPQHQKQKTEEQFEGEAEDGPESGAVVAAVALQALLTAALAAVLAALTLHIVVVCCRCWSVSSRLRPVGNQLTVFIMVAVVHWLPVCPTHVAKLVAASAGHMIAALILFNHKLAPFALPVVQVVFEKLQFFIVAEPSVSRQQALTAKLLTTAVTSHSVLFASNGADDALTVLTGAQFGVGVVGNSEELVHFPIILLDVGGQLFEEVSAGVQQPLAFIPGTGDLLEVLDLVDDVVVQTRLAEGLLMLAVAHVQHLVGHLHLLLTNLAVHHVHEALNHPRHPLRPLRLQQLRLLLLPLPPPPAPLLQSIQQPSWYLASAPYHRHGYSVDHRGIHGLLATNLRAGVGSSCSF